jgi:hypothetical protein
VVASAAAGLSSCYGRIAEDGVGSPLWPLPRTAPGHSNGRVTCARRQIRPSRFEGALQENEPRNRGSSGMGSPRLRCVWMRDGFGSLSTLVAIDLI